MANKFSRFNKSNTQASDNRSSNVKYNVISNEFVEWEPNNFIEISHKSYDAGNDGGAGEFYALSRGYYATGNGDVEQGTPIYQKSLTLPSDDAFLDSFIGALDKIFS